jgi:hypothetical protein
MTVSKLAKPAVVDVTLHFNSSQVYFITASKHNILSDHYLVLKNHRGHCACQLREENHKSRLNFRGPKGRPSGISFGGTASRTFLCDGPMRRRYGCTCEIYSHQSRLSLWNSWKRKCWREVGCSLRKMSTGIHGKSDKGRDRLVRLFEGSCLRGRRAVGVSTLSK